MNSNLMNKKIIFALAAVLVVVIALIIQASLAARQSVTIHLANPVTLQLYKAVEEDENLVPVGEPVRTTIVSDEKFTVSKGDYVLVPSGEEYDTTTIPLTVAGTPVVKTVDVPFNQKRLADLLSQELPAITIAMVAAYPKISSDYTINPGLLFGRGEWFGTTLSNKQGPLLNINGDTLRIVLHKENNVWTVSSKPPAIVLSSPTYKNIPINVLKSVNAIKTESTDLSE